MYLQSDTSGTQISIFFEIFDKWRYKNVLIQEAKIAKVLNFDVAIFRNVVLIYFYKSTVFKLPNYKYYKSLSNMDQILWSRKDRDYFRIFHCLGYVPCLTLKYLLSIFLPYTHSCHIISSKQKCCLLFNGVSTESQKLTSVRQLRRDFFRQIWLVCMLDLHWVMWSFYFPLGKYICAIWWHGISTNSGDSYEH